jgi:patatin-like phospholipase/acyl hydrolase
MKKRVKILSIDGGGMRGVVPAMILAEIERVAGKPASQLFDIISGTSTGSIIAGCLVTPDESGAPKFPAASLVRLYEEEGPKVFPHSAWRRVATVGSTIDAKYPSDGAFDLFQRLYGDLKLVDTLTDLLIPSFELELGAPFFFSRHDARTDEARNFYLKQAVHASISAPTFFEPYVIKSPDLSRLKHLVFVDGAVIANNPAMCAYVEAKHLYPHAQEYVVVSLGAGDFGAQQLYEEKKGWGVVQWARPLLNILLVGSVDVVDHQMKVLHESPGDKLTQYYRYQIPLSKGDSPLDDASGLNLHALELAAENMIREDRARIEEMCALL